MSFQTAQTVLFSEGAARPESETSRPASISLRDGCQTIWRHRRLIAIIEIVLLLACLLYCFFAPNQYEAKSRVELRTQPASSLNFEQPGDAFTSASVLSAPLSIETLASVLRSDQLAWRVIVELRLYQQDGFRGRFQKKFPNFNPEQPSPAAQAWLIDRFASHLHVQSMPHTFLVEVRFRCHDSGLSAAVVNALIRAYQEQEIESQIQNTAQASGWLNSQLTGLKSRVDRDQQRLADFEAQHNLVSTPEMQANGVQGETEHNAAILEIDELSRQLVAATSDRILREAEYRAASQGDPEMVIASDPRLQADNSNFATAILQQLHARRSDLEQEQALLSAEHGESFPRVVEISRQLADLDRQRRAEDAKLVDSFRSNWQTAVDREQLVRNSLDQATSEGLRVNQAAMQYAVMRQEANSSHDLYLRVLEKSQEAGLAAGVHSSDISIVDAAREPAKPVAPNLPLCFGITFFVGLWIAVAAAFLRDSLAGSARLIMILMALLGCAAMPNAQAPSPNTSGLPGGVVNLPQTQQTRTTPNPSEAPTVWNNSQTTGAPQTTNVQSSQPMPAPIAPGDALEVSEYHTPEFHSIVRVAPDGTVTLPMIGEINLSGMDEQTAAHAIEAALLKKRMLLHPLVSVLVTAYAGQDVSVLGEVNRPGIYPYTYHHRLLDLISAAQGLSPNAGRLVNVFHANESKTPHPVVLDPSGTDTTAEHNPELLPGDTVQVSRAGLVYVVGDVIRPGGFPVDPVQGLTIVQALSLAWGPSQNAAVTHAVLIREQKGGRTMVALNLKRMLRGQDPDQPIQDRDILFVPDSFGKNLANRTMESAIQSAIGVSIYSGLVYSQRY